MRRRAAAFTELLSRLLIAPQSVLRETVLGMNEIATQQVSQGCCLGHQRLPWESETKKKSVRALKRAEGKAKASCANLKHRKRGMEMSACRTGLLFLLLPHTGAGSRSRFTPLPPQRHSTVYSFCPERKAVWAWAYPNLEYYHDLPPIRNRSNDAEDHLAAQLVHVSAAAMRQTGSHVLHRGVLWGFRPL